MDKFEIWTELFPIGQGGMSNVYSAKAPDGEKVAIKFLHENFVNNLEVKNRFIREANILKDLKIDGIAHILDFDFEHKQPFIVTEFIEGQTLEVQIKENGPFELDYAIEIFAGLASTISALHEKGIYHRDIKPANIMISSGKPVLIDFSISTFENATALTQVGSVIGTPQYLSPESHLGELSDSGRSPKSDISASSDWWGFSAALCFCLTGRAPFGEPSATLSNINARNIDLEGLSFTEREILSNALEPEIENRSGPWETLDALASITKKERSDDKKAIIRHTLIVAMLALAAILAYLIFL
jgi:serine/threonine protein kinase